MKIKKDNYPYVAKVKLPKGQEEYFTSFKNNDHVLILGEITNMPGHMVLVTRDNQVLWGYHKEDFIKLTDEET